MKSSKVFEKTSSIYHREFEESSKPSHTNKLAMQYASMKRQLQYFTLKTLQK